ncbi:MAG: hypothetical protein QM802_19915 [Agriterribacter sp.]
MECLNNVIGITRTECECFTPDFDANAAISVSGLYMDELAECPIKLSTIKAGTQLCEQIQTKMVNARSSAISFFKEELFKQLATKYSQSAAPYQGLIGGSSWTKNFPVSMPYAGIYLQAKSMVGATMKISQIDTYFAQSASFDVLIYLNDMLLDTVPVTSIADSKKSNTITPELEYPLTDTNGEPYNFKIVYNTTGLVPKDNAMSCGCGGRESGLDKFLSRKGIMFQTINNITTSGFTYGLNLVVNIRCGTDDIICNAYNDDEFIRAVIPASIQRKSVEFLIADLLASKVIDRETMANREVMGVNAAKLHNKFKNDVQWIAERINLTGNGCFACNPQARNVTFGGIRL